MLEKIANKLMCAETLGKLFMLWLITTIIASALSVSFITNTASIAATNEPLEETVSTDRTLEPQTLDTDLQATIQQQTALPQRLIIESLGIDLSVINPTTTDVAVLDKELMNGAVRYPTSGLLGENGKNMVIFGHSARIPGYYGMYRAFNDIEKLSEGETIALQSGGKEYVYRVSKVEKKSANTGEIALGANNNKLTLVTCDGFGKKTDRWVVEADFLGAYDL